MSGDAAVEAFSIVASDGARADLTTHGAQVTGWRCAHDPIERLYLSPTTERRAGAAIRGGIPVCFPQFAGRGVLPKHGFARTMNWRIVERGFTDGGAGIARLSLSDDAATRRLWPHGFAADITVTVEADRLAVALDVANVGADSFDVTAALHTYVAVPDVRATRVEGLAGSSYVDTADGDAEKTETAASIVFGEEVDRIYAVTRGPVDVRAPGQHMRLAATGFADTAVWNPGPRRAATIADLPPGGWRHFVCVEAATALTPRRIAPGERWRGTQTLTLVRTR